MYTIAAIGGSTYLSYGLYPRNKHLDTAKFVQHLQAQTLVFAS